MQNSTRTANRSRFLSLSKVLLLAVGLTSSAFASLGGDASSVEADRAKMQASLQTTKTDSFTVHEVHTPARTVIREYVSPGGRVFGVSWTGPFIPDMQQILGDHFQQYVSAAKAASSPGSGRRPLHIEQPNFVLHNSGHMRFYSGKAYDPSLLPQGVTANDVR